MTEQPNHEVAVLNAALELRRAERPAYLDQACAGDAALRQRVEELLRAHDQAEEFLVSPPAGLDFNRTAKVNIPLTEKPGDRIGRYKLLQQIGEGGCGVVYMAEQEEPVKRRVALKIIKLGMDTKQVIARFEAERQALALMDHPNIAKVLDAGATETGRPYFVMELVRGIKITEFCDQNKVPTEERLRLFIQVCQAIQHAHQKGVIHRDIKPSNILVTVNEPGSPGVPKVIDFGIAKATAGRLTDQTLFTAFEQFIGTPAYMSPEQAVMTALDIDTRSDVYSLGVLLYELLTGKTPFDQKELLASGLDEMRRTILEREPLKPSTRLNTMVEVELTTTAKHQQTEPPKLVHLVRGDLDWIVMKCLEKDRTRRYETANGLATDIARHLGNEPIVARPPSQLYRFQKSVQRNKLAFGAATAVALALVIGLAVAMAMFFRAQAEKKKAQTEAVRSAQVAQFLKDMLEGVGPSVALGRDTRLLKEILDQTAERVGKDLTNQPEVEAELRSTMGDVYHAIREYQKAEAMYRDALAIRRKLWGNENAAVAASLEGVGRALWKKRRVTEAKDALEEALAIRRKVLGNNHPEVASSLNNLGRLFNLEGKDVEAERCHQEALAILRQQGDGNRTEVAETLRLLARAKQHLGKLQEAEDAIREALALLENQPDSTAGALSFSAYLLELQGRLPEAEATYRKSQAVFRHVLGNESPELGAENNALAHVLISAGKLEEAASLYLETVHLWIAAAAQGDSQYQAGIHRLADAMMRLASLLQDQGKTDRAAVLQQEATRVLQTLADTEDPIAQSHMGWAYANGKGVDRDLVQAVKWYRKAAEQSYSWAQNTLGRMYEQGEGVDKDFVAAFEWYRKAATNGYASAQYNVGWMYYTGRGVAKNETEAAKWYLKAAESGDAWAQLELARMYTLGLGVEKNESEGAKWLQKATANGNPQALNDVAWRLATSSDEGRRNGTNAVAFAEKAVAATGRTNAMFLDTLAAAYAETGDFQKAISTQKEAIALLGAGDDMSIYEAHLKLFEARTPCRE